MKRKYEDLLKINLPKILFIRRLLPVCALLSVFSVAGKGVTLWHNTNTTTISSTNSLACTDNTLGTHRNNSYWRSFTPSAFGQTGTFTVTGVRIGVEQSNTTQPITIRIYTNTGGAFPDGTRTQIGSLVTTVPGGNSVFRDFTVPASAQPVTTEIVVEVFTPDGTAGFRRFFIGSNNLGQSAPSYISAADCGVPNPTNLADIGYPSMHTLIGLVGNNVPTAANVSVSGRVTTADGRGIRNARVSITLPTGEVRAVLSGAFGHYRSNDLEAGQTYVLSIVAKRFTFSNPTRIVSLNDELTGEDFIADGS